MYKVVPRLIPRAAMIRARCLELGSLQDHHGTSTLVAAAPSATNIYVLARGEREGLAPGERLEVYGDRVRLVRTLAHGCPRGLTLRSAYTGRLTDEALREITEQLEKLQPSGNGAGRLTTTTDMTTIPVNNATSSVNPHNAISGDNSATGHSKTTKSETKNQVCSKWTLQLPPLGYSRVLRPQLPVDVDSLRGSALAAQLQRLRVSSEEVVVAEWLRCDADAPQETVTDAHPSDKEKVGDSLLIENGVCFRSPESCGLRTLRAARLAFVSSIERSSNGIAHRRRSQQLQQHQPMQSRTPQQRQHRLFVEDVKPLAVLDVSAIDFTFAEAAFQSTLELGMHTGDGCQITHVPLTDEAACKVDVQSSSYIRTVVATPADVRRSGAAVTQGQKGFGAGRAHQCPFDFIQIYSIDVAAYTAYLPLPPAPLTATEAAGGCASAEAETVEEQQQQLARSRSGKGGEDDRYARGRAACRSERQRRSRQLSQAMATLRRGACMLVTFVPTPATVAALYEEMESQHHAEVLIEHRMVSYSKACVAEAISLTGRWGCITDEVLPAVDSAQGSSYSLMVVLE